MKKLHAIRSGLADAIKVASKADCTPPYTICERAHSMTDADMIRFYRATGRIVVWPGGSSNTIYGSPEVNWIFRAWHDWNHLLSGVCNRQHGLLGCFEPRAEYAVADYQCRKLGTRLAELVQIEVTGQADHFERTGTFVADQIAFTLDKLRA